MRESLYTVALAIGCEPSKTVPMCALIEEERISFLNIKTNKMNNETYAMDKMIYNNERLNDECYQFDKGIALCELLNSMR